MSKRNPNFDPYTSITVSSLRAGDKLLEYLLSSRGELFPRKMDKPVILYGAGSLGKMAKNFFDYLRIPYLYVVDKNASRYKTDKYWQGVEIVYPDDVEEIDKRNCLLVICIVTAPLIALRDQLQNEGWKDITFFYDISEFYSDRYPINNGWFLHEIDKKGKESIRKVFFSLTDEVSRAYYLQFLAWRRLRVELLFENLKINLNNRFFIPEVADALKESEVFVDCGAHKGFVTEKFIKIVNNKYKKIYAIEPDDINLNALKTRLHGTSNLEIIKCALSSKDGESSFYQGFDFASKLSKNGNSVVKTVTLDSLKIPATFIKMHLEGGELDALRGAVNTIQKYRPIITVTIYHNSDGVWKIPLFLISNARNYKYYMKLHSWGGTGAVFYAIPKKRSTNLEYYRR
jgi:FkbM family methyltransferase